jgi:hypothetical protein
MAKPFRTIQIAIACLAVSLVPARADYQHAFATAGALGPPALNGGGESRGEIAASSSASLIETPDETRGYTVNRSAYARSGAASNSGVTPQALLGIAGNIAMTNNGFNGGGQFRNVIAGNQWSDTFSLNTNGFTSPIHMQFDFFSHGLMAYNDAYGLSQSFHAYLNSLPGSDGFGNFRTADQTATTKFGYAAGQYDQLVNNGWTSFEINPVGTTGIVEYTGKITLDLIINPDKRGWATRGTLLLESSLGLEMILGSGFSRTFVDGTGTAGLSSIVVLDPTLGRVTPESLGMTISFDSGMLSPNLTSVPEPSSAASLFIGMAGLLIYTRRHYRSIAVEVVRPQ